MKIICIIILLISIQVLVFSQDTAMTGLISKGQNINISDYKALSIDSKRLHIIEKAREYIGAKYKWGESGENGFDCSGYVKYVYGYFGYTLPHSSYAQYNTSKRLTENKAKPGDLVFFVTHGNRISHVGIYLGDNNFIHAPGIGKYVRVESLDSGFYRKTLAGFGSLF